MIKEWLAANPIGIEDGLRHDKWCAMMWPRIRLLHELLADDGSIWITLDDNEVHRARSILDEVFGENSAIGQIVWQKRTSRENRAVLSPSFDHILVYSKSLKDTWKLRRNRLLPKEDGHANPDNDPRGLWASIPFSAQGYRENQVYTIKTPTGIEHRPPKGRCWGATEPEFERFKQLNLVYWPKSGEPNPLQVEILRKMAEVDDVTLRFEGQQYHKDVTLSAKDKQALREVLDAWDALTGAN